MELIDQHVESLIFTSGQPITESEITTSMQRALDEKISEEDVNASIERLMDKYKSEEFAFEIVPISKGYHFMTKGSYHTTVGEHLKVISKKKLSRAALETLSIIAYKQPVTRIDLESIRGVSCDYTIQKLMEKELVEMQGRAEGPGRPLLYGTSDKFMDYFGIKDLKELPKPKDFEMPETEVGEPAPIEVVVPTESNEADDTVIDNDTDSDMESDEVTSMMEVNEVRAKNINQEDLKVKLDESSTNGSHDPNQEKREEVKTIEENSIIENGISATTNAHTISDEKIEIQQTSEEEE